MKLLVDNQLPEALAAFLAANGIESRHVRRLGLGAVSDAEIWNFASAEGFGIVNRGPFALLSIVPSNPSPFCQATC